MAGPVQRDLRACREVFSGTLKPFSGKRPLQKDPFANWLLFSFAPGGGNGVHSVTAGPGFPVTGGVVFEGTLPAAYWRRDRVPGSAP